MTVVVTVTVEQVCGSGTGHGTGQGTGQGVGQGTGAGTGQDVGAGDGRCVGGICTVGCSVAVNPPPSPLGEAVEGSKVGE